MAPPSTASSRTRSSLVRRVAKGLLPDQVWAKLVRGRLSTGSVAARYHRTTAWPPAGTVRFGSLRRTMPFGRLFGAERGSPIDRYYIEDFLRRGTGSDGHAPGAIRGRVLEIGENRYASAFGDDAVVDGVDILDIATTNPDATIVADLADGAGIPSDAFDCVICTQTLLLIYDVRAAVHTLHRALRPGGTVFVTVPGIAKISPPGTEDWDDYWRFTTASARRLFEEVFDPANVTVESYGNVLSVAAFLYGLATQDLKRDELDVRDPEYQLLIAVTAVK